MKSYVNPLHLFVQNILGLKEIPQQFFLQVYYTFHKIPEARWAQWTADSCSVKSSCLSVYLNHLCSQSRRCDSGSVLSVLPGHVDADEEFSGFIWRWGSSPRPVCSQPGVEFSYWWVLKKLLWIYNVTDRCLYTFFLCCSPERSGRHSSDGCCVFRWGHRTPFLQSHRENCQRTASFQSPAPFRDCSQWHGDYFQWHREGE